MLSQASLMAQWVKKKKKSTCNARDIGNVDLTPGLGRPLEEENGDPLQYPCLKKSHRQRSLVGHSPKVTKSWTQLSDYTYTQK